MIVAAFSSGRSATLSVAGSCEPPAIADDKDKQLQEKDAELKRIQEMVAQMKSSELAISLQEQKLLTQIKQQIITLAIKRVVTKLKQDLTISQHVLIINKCITRLGGLN